jgi:hypothetical protein
MRKNLNKNHCTKRKRSFHAIAKSIVPLAPLQEFFSGERKSVLQMANDLLAGAFRCGRSRLKSLSARITDNRVLALRHRANWKQSFSLTKNNSHPAEIVFDSLLAAERSS